MKEKLEKLLAAAEAVTDETKATTACVIVTAFGEIHVISSLGKMTTFRLTDQQ